MIELLVRNKEKSKANAMVTPSETPRDTQTALTWNYSKRCKYN